MGLSDSNTDFGKLLWMRCQKGLSRKYKLEEIEGWKSFLKMEVDKCVEGLMNGKSNLQEIYF